MARGLFQWRLGFRAKVLLPVFLLLVALAAFMFWLVNRRFRQQLETEARRAAESANAGFDSYQKVRMRDLRARYRYLAADSRLRDVVRTRDAPTIEYLLRELQGEFGAQAAIFTSAAGNPPVGTSSGGGRLWQEVQTHSAPSVREALAGSFNIATLSAADRLWDVVSLPLAVNEFPAAFTFAHEMGATLASEIKQLTHSDVLFVADGKIVAGTLGMGRERAVLEQVAGSRLGRDQTGASSEAVPVRVEGKRYLRVGGVLPGLSQEQQLGYVLLFSSESAWQELRATQGRLAAASLGAILLSCGLVWLLVRRATRPLVMLRDGAEAVGRGDLSRQVPVSTRDECGELAAAFNRMTDNLRLSRAELEQTVERLRTTQAQLVQTEKLAAVGEFVAGVTHELNNPLTVVIGFADLMQQTSSLGPKDREDLRQIVEGAQRCRQIVRSLLSFARKYKPERKLSDLNELVENTLSFVQYEFRTGNIKVLRQLEANLPKVMVDPHQLQQVFLNIVSNARQAMEDYRQEGELRVATAGDSARLRVTFADNGPGIAPENLGRIFDPFFTTKAVGKGTGLGLSLSYGIIQEHGGTIRVASKPGEGTTFTIELPVTTVVSAPDGTPAKLRDSAPAPPTRADNRRVLVIDDEPAILSLIEATLRPQGYEVETAADGEEGVRRARNSLFHLIVCDWKMPGLNGRQVLERLQAECPAAAQRLVFMTGDVVNERTQEFLREKGKFCLAKPFSLEDFRAAVARLAA